MMDLKQYNEEQYKMLYLSIADTSSGICLFRADDSGIQASIAERLQRESSKNCCILNMAQIGKDSMPDSIGKMRRLLEGYEDCDVVIVCNLQLCGIEAGDEVYIQNLNHMRDQLLAMQKVWVLGMSHYFAVLLSKQARDIYSCIMNHFEFKEDEKEAPWIFAENDFTGDIKIQLLHFKSLQGEIKKKGPENASVRELLDLVGIWVDICEYCTSGTVTWMKKVLKKIDESMPQSGLAPREALEYLNLALAYYYLEKPETSLRILLSVKEQMETVWSQQSREMTMIDSYLGIVYRSLRRYDDADNCLYKAKEYYEKTGRENSSEYFKVMNAIALIKLYRGDGDEAVNLYRDLIAYTEKDPNTNREDLSRLWNNLGASYLIKLEYSEALNCFQKTEELLKEAGSVSVKSDGHALQNIGYAYMMLGDERKAIEYLEKSKKRFLQIDESIRKTGRIKMIDRLISQCHEKLDENASLTQGKI